MVNIVKLLVDHISLDKHTTTIIINVFYNYFMFNNVYCNLYISNNYYDIINWMMNKENYILINS